jgi:2-amino-4-hydroxy-6-hydroxymethyldihydropteridine diphosphokinase
MNQRLKIAIGLGSNLSDRLEVLKRAARVLADEFLDQARSSKVVESPPWGPIARQPNFLNAVMTGWVEWKPPAIVSYLKQLERDLGRVSGERYGPRLIDLDLLAYDEKTWDTDGVSVPHPKMLERCFVLGPLAEVWPDWRHPITGKGAAQMWADFQETRPVVSKGFAAPLLDKENR